MSDTPWSASPIRGAEKAGTEKETSTVETLAYKDPAEGLRKIQSEYEHWTGTLTRGSFELSVALIAANWAVFGTVNRVLDNFFSKGSILLVVVNLVLNLGGARVMSEKLRCRWEEAERDPEKWRREWQEAAHTKKEWPFTRNIQSLGTVLRRGKVWLPFLGGVSFLIALLSS